MPVNEYKIENSVIKDYVNKMILIFFVLIVSVSLLTLVIRQFGRDTFGGLMQNYCNSFTCQELTLVLHQAIELFSTFYILLVNTMT